MDVQDTTFHERVLDLANLVLVCMAGPEAQHSMASAVDPDRDQVLPQALLLTEIMLLVVSGTTAQHLYCPTGLATRRRISVTYHSCMVLPSIENVNSNFPSGHAVPCQLACAVLLLLSPISWPPNFHGPNPPAPPLLSALSHPLSSQVL